MYMYIISNSKLLNLLFTGYSAAVTMFVHGTGKFLKWGIFFIL